MKINEVLRTLRKNAGLTQREVYEKLGVKQSTFSSWETGAHEPSASMLLELCKLYNIGEAVTIFFGDITEEGNFVLNEGEYSLIQSIRNLPENISKPLKDLIFNLDKSYSSIKEINIHGLKSQSSISHPVYIMPASAGTGQFLDSDDYELIDFPENSVPRDSNFAVRVSGDSMEPEFSNGSVVFVKKTKSLEPGDVGIFIVNNEGYLKILGKDNNLISINPKYKDILIRQYDDCRIVGKVVGVYNE